MMKYPVFGILSFLASISAVYAELPGDAALTTLQSMAAGDGDIEKAGEAAKSLQNDAPKDCLRSLQAMKSATPVGKNWLSAVACAQYQRADHISINNELEAFLGDQSQDQEARTLVFHWLTDDNAELQTEKLKSMTQDASPELRYAAINQAISQLDQEQLDTAQLERLLDCARHPDQVRTVIKLLGKVGKEIDQAKLFGFIKEWDLIGPFDNRQPEQFDAAYPVESDLLAGDFDREKSYVGKGDAPVKWRHFHTDDEEGKVNLAELYEKEKGAAVYAYTTIEIAQEQPAFISLTTVNGSKVWLNGELVMSNNVYHVGARLDQYLAKVQLKSGKNMLVFKIMQNEQTEPFAQEYQFHCRIADPTLKGIEFAQAN
jgi:hypothetical protein